MIRLTYPEYVVERDSFDDAVGRTSEISQFCSASTWGIAANAHLRSAGSKSRDYLIARENGHWLTFVSRGSYYFEPFENEWMFGSPVIGPSPEARIDLFSRAARQYVGEPRAYVISGILQDSCWHRKLRQFGNQATSYQEFEGTSSMVIDLEAGVGAWLERRSRKFRKNLRAAGRKVKAAGVTIAPGEGSARELFERILTIQKGTRKWKGGTDVFQYEDSLPFYRQILSDLQEKGHLRIQFARSGDRDVAYVFGGIFGGTYRGLQMSYLEDFAHLGLGNIMQLDNIKRIRSEGLGGYDLGMPSEYKESWADREIHSIVSVIVL